MKELKFIPKLQLYIKTSKGAESTGPHRVKFIADKVTIGVNPETGKDREEFHFLVEENGVKKSWIVPVLGKDGKPSYLFNRLADIEEGDEVILEGKRFGVKNYTSVLKVKRGKE